MASTSKAPLKCLGLDHDFCFEVPFTLALEGAGDWYSEPSAALFLAEGIIFSRLEDCFGTLTLVGRGVIKSGTLSSSESSEVGSLSLGVDEGRDERGHLSRHKRAPAHHRCSEARTAGKGEATLFSEEVRVYCGVEYGMDRVSTSLYSIFILAVGGKFVLN